MGIMAAARALIGQPAGNANQKATARPARNTTGRPASSPRDGFVSRMANAAFALNGWNDLFSRWLPSQELHAIVVAQGSKTTPNQAVLHTALSIAMGILKNRRLANIAFKVRVDHTLNQAEVGFGISTNPLLDFTNVLGALGESIKEGVAGGRYRGVLGFAISTVEAVPGVFKRGQAAAPPAIPGAQPGPAPGKNLKDAQRDVFDRINLEIGSGAAWDMWREEIRGGQPPKIMEVQGQKPFDDMRGELHLTRAAAANPQPPAALGFDLRTLVAQVLHDPGVRPPLPRTDQGPPVIENELVGA